jgi:hypothetical protein
MLRGDAFVRQLSRNLYQWNPDSKVRIINWQNIIHIPGSENIVLDNFLYKLRLIGI